MQKEEQETVTLSKKEYENILAKNHYLEQELANIRRMLFGRKSERYVPEDPAQLNLFDVPKETVEETQEEVKYTRKKNKSLDKKGHSRQVIPEDLPREEIIIEPIAIPEGSKKIGEVITEILEYKPGVMYVKKYIRPKYACPQGEGVVIADMPSLPIPKGNAGASLIAYLFVSKYVDHLPFHRIKKIFKRLGIDIAESTINDWFKAACKLLEPLYDKLYQSVQNCDYIMADESPMPVKTKEKENAMHKGYQWVYHNPVNNLVCFDYRKTRGREGPEEFFKDFKGAIQTDGYAGYNRFGEEDDIKLLACLAHIRRKYESSLKDHPVLAKYALEQIQLLYKIERKAKDEQLSFKERKELRQKEAVPILTSFEKWMKSEAAKCYIPKSDIAKALNYAIKLWPRIVRYVDDGRYEIDNNPVESSIRPLALGRKNFMFAGSHQAAQYAAMAYSFFGTCKMNNIEPYAWLKDVLDRISDYPANRLEELLPNNWKK